MFPLWKQYCSYIHVPFREHIPHLFIATSVNLPVCLGTWNFEKPLIVRRSVIGYTGSRVIYSLQ